MKAKLKSWYCPDIDDLLNYSPENPENFCFLFRAMVGPCDEEGSESFDIQICTPQWLLCKLNKRDVFLARHFAIVLEYNFEIILNTIKQLIESCNGSDWNAVAHKVGRIGYWEFEDYQG